MFISDTTSMDPEVRIYSNETYSIEKLIEILNGYIKEGIETICFEPTMHYDSVGLDIITERKITEAERIESTKALIKQADQRNSLQLLQALEIVKRIKPELLVETVMEDLPFKDTKPT